MIVVTLTDCPPALRGDMTKWLQEISPGVYVGNVGARVREELWKRIKDNAKMGRAAMVYSADNEQRMNFCVHNGSWEPIDFDGLKLMLRPSSGRRKSNARLQSGFSNASKFLKARQMAGRNRSQQASRDQYVVIDIETTGLSSIKDEIIEIGALSVNGGIVEKRFHALIKIQFPIPQPVQHLTGITDSRLALEGRDLSSVLPEFLSFASDSLVVSHNAEFDYSFLRTACEACGLQPFSNPCADTLTLARRLVDDVDNYKLTTLAQFFDIQTGNAHNCMDDCLTTKQLYEKLNEIRQSP